jgi:hypothetical protein
MSNTPPRIATPDESPWQPTHRHYKGGLYRELHRALHSETEEALVVYQSADGRIWVRSAAMFDEALPDGRPRFALLPDRPPL